MQARILHDRRSQFDSRERLAGRPAGRLFFHLPRPCFFLLSLRSHYIQTCKKRDAAAIAGDGGQAGQASEAKPPAAAKPKGPHPGGSCFSSIFGPFALSDRFFDYPVPPSPPPFFHGAPFLGYSKLEVPDCLVRTAGRKVEKQFCLQGKSILFMIFGNICRIQKDLG